jgi:hypothetical protein
VKSTFVIISYNLKQISAKTFIVYVVYEVITLYR